MLLSQKKRNAGLLKLLCFIALISINLLLFIIMITPPAAGYEISIYGAYPWYFWVLLIGSIFSGIFIVVLKSLNIEESNLWYLGFLIIVLANSIFLLLPNFRGYALYGQGNQDILTHLGYVKDIIMNGYIGQNFYPIIHILITIISEISKVPIESSTVIFQIFLIPLYMILIYLLCKRISVDRNLTLLSIAFSAPLLYSFFLKSLHPSLYSLYLIPLILYFYHREKFKTEFSICILLLAFTITFFHPVTSLFMIGIFITLKYSYFLKLRSTANKFKINSGSIGTRLSLIMIITFFSWYFSFSVVTQNFKKVTDWLIFEIGPSVSEKYMGKLQASELSPIQIIKLFFYQYGAITIYFLISMLVFIYYVIYIKRKNHYVYIYFILLVFAFFVSIIFGFGYFAEGNLLRILRLPIMISTIFNSIIFIEISKIYTHKRKLLAVFVILIASSSAAISIFNTYYSPLTATANSHLTRMELNGAKWSIEHFNHNNYTTFSYVTINRYEDYLLGVREADKNPLKRDENPIPSHFGYDGNDSISKVFEFRGTFLKERYMLTSTVDRVHPNVYPENTRYKAHIYNEDDFIKLKSDAAVSKIYTNGEFEAWRLYGNKQ